MTEWLFWVPGSTPKDFFLSEDADTEQIQFGSFLVFFPNHFMPEERGKHLFRAGIKTSPMTLQATALTTSSSSYNDIP